ncbi:galactarate dehydratase [uncultured Paludibaculum sp.]|uniref:galactarate dehydratase n=1 Tax=uncultured Paludibaculum sp. TaxID=1765020 RepID=UPI002AAB89B5|nr:galactarate dehydratase [uncultured Paludibaculum sp.]
MRPLYVRVHARDNVAIIVNPEGLPAGSAFADGLTLAEFIPQAHKVALEDIGAGDPVIRYGEIIGRATRAIPRGSWVREELLSLPSAPALNQLPRATAVPPALPPIENITFDGYPNPDGTAGTRNILGITTTVQCVAPTVDYAVQRIKAELLPHYPNVDDVVAITHTYGCGVAIQAPGAAVPIRTIRNLALNPNLGESPLIVSLGCEKLQPARLFPQPPGLPVLPNDEPFVVRLQDQHGFQDMIVAILRFAEKRLEELNRRRRVPCPASQLTVGLQCGGSDAFSGVTANPAVGHAADLLVRAGATVLFSEVTEVRDAVHLLTPRAVNEEVALALIHEMAWYDEYLERGSADRSANPTPGNKRGGLANIVEKALGSVAKAGTSPLMGVSAPGERVTTKGLVFAATPASDFICGTLQLAAGMNLHVFTTGEGTPYGLAMAPVIKVSSRTALAERWPDLIDVDAGRIAMGQATIQDIGQEIFHLILEVASGRRKTWAETWKLHNAPALFNPGPVT